MTQTEKQAKHTPGPWSADKWATGYAVSAPESQYSVCRLDDCNNDEANARLIAAAPTMYIYLTELASRGDNEAHAIVSKIAGS